jgi:hypothetical protein
MNQIDLFPGYVIDTSALIDLKPYPKDIFKSVWKNVEKLITDGRLIAPSEVREELLKQRDEIQQWAKTQKFFIQLTPDLFLLAQTITKHFPRLIDPNKATPKMSPV